MKFLNEFKSFAIKGNMVDLAVGVIIGGAFGKIVASLVSDVIMPPLGFLIGGVQFNWLKFVVREAHTNSTGEMVEAVTINYGNFIQASIDFLIIALVIFMMIKLMNKLRDKEEQAAPPVPPSKEEVLLTEIRDLLREQQKK